jgi:tetratricopeptide (TPR) repeat protein
MARATEPGKPSPKAKDKPAAKAPTSAETPSSAKAKAEPAADPAATPPAASPKTERPSEADAASARERLAATGRNDACPCGSGKKYKKCHLAADEQAAAPPVVAPDAKELAASGWRLFEQRRPGAAEKDFRAALAIDADLADARVGIGMARLSAGDAAGAKQELGAVLTAGESAAAALRAKQSKDAFGDPALQPYIRAAHALGCLAYDEDRFEDAVKDLERVHAIDEGMVGVEARLIASKALMKLERPADAAALLEPASKAETNASRAQHGLALARFTLGDQAGARAALAAALDDNPHYGKAVLGRVRRHVENVAAAGEGTLEQALLYAQTYADVWTEPAKKFLAEVLDERAAARRTSTPEADTDAARDPNRRRYFL